MLEHNKSTFCLDTEDLSTKAHVHGSLYQYITPAVTTNHDNSSSTSHNILNNPQVPTDSYTTNTNILQQTNFILIKNKEATKDKFDRMLKKV